MYYCTTVLLYYCTTELLHYCTTTTALLHYCTTTVYYCTTALLYYCTTVLLYYCTTVLLHYCTTVLLYYCTLYCHVRFYFMGSLRVSSSYLCLCLSFISGIFFSLLVVFPLFFSWPFLLSLEFCRCSSDILFYFPADHLLPDWQPRISLLDVVQARSVD